MQHKCKGGNKYSKGKIILKNSESLSNANSLNVQDFYDVIIEDNTQVEVSFSQKYVPEEI